MASSIHASAVSSAAAAAGAVFDDLVRVETRLYNLLSDRLQKAHGVTGSQFEFLSYLNQYPAARVADLAGYFAVGIGATSKSVDRLATAGWVQRTPNPADGRSSLLQLTDAGIELVHQAKETFEHVLVEHVANVVGLTALAELQPALQLLRTDLEAKRAGLPTG